ncbi:MAG: HesA/MoeB/ThiF family protein [Acidimicrobiales bacterium]
MRATLRVAPTLWSKLTDDLLSTPDLERAGVGFAGLANHSPNAQLLLRDWMPVPNHEYLVQLGNHLEVSPAFWARAAKRARSSGEALVITHSHPRDPKRPRFSPSDDYGEDQLIPKIQSRAPVPVAAVVVSPGGLSARITGPGSGERRALAVHVVGESRAADGGVHADERFDRQLRVLGREGQAILRSLTIGVVGAGGLGSHVIEQLVHLGVGKIVVVDPDRVTTSNLSRLVGATRIDAMLRRNKTHIARRLARRVGGGTRIARIPRSVTYEDGARPLLDCDVIVGCTDNHWSRTVLNAIGYQFLIPVLDLGVELQAEALGGRVSWLMPGLGCLWCAGILDAERVRAEQLPRATYVEERARGYIVGLDEPAPAVISINGVVASLGVTELLARYTRFAGKEPRGAMLVYRLSDGVVRRTSPSPRPGCPTCSPDGVMGAGDLSSPPWLSGEGGRSGN